MSLREIAEFAKQNDTDIEYLNDLENGYYWLKGQKKKHIDDPITMEEIQQVIELDRCRKLEYGTTNSWEQYSWEQHSHKFEQLLHQMNRRESKSTQLPVEN